MHPRIRNQIETILVGAAVGYAARGAVMALIGFSAAAMSVTVPVWAAVPVTAVIAGATSRVAIRLSRRVFKGEALEKGWAMHAVKQGFVSGLVGGAIGAAVSEFMPMEHIYRAVHDWLIGGHHAAILPPGPILQPTPILTKIPDRIPEMIPPSLALQQPALPSVTKFELPSLSKLASQILPKLQFRLPQIPDLSSVALPAFDVRHATVELQNFTATDNFRHLSPQLRAVAAQVLKSHDPKRMEFFLKEASFSLINGRGHTPATAAAGAYLIGLGTRVADHLGLRDACADMLYRDKAYLELYGTCGTPKNVAAALGHAKQAGAIGRQFVNYISKQRLLTASM